MTGEDDLVVDANTFSLWMQNNKRGLVARREKTI